MAKIIHRDVHRKYTMIHSRMVDGSVRQSRRTNLRFSTMDFSAIERRMFNYFAQANKTALEIGTAAHEVGAALAELVNSNLYGGWKKENQHKIDKARENRKVQHAKH